MTKNFKKDEKFSLLVYNIISIKPIKLMKNKYERGLSIMNKGELVNSISSKSGLNKKNSEAALDAIIAAVKETLKKGDKVTLVGFGTFEVRKRAARQGVNPQTKKKIKIPAKKAPVFKAGKGLKDIVNK